MTSFTPTVNRWFSLSLSPAYFANCYDGFHGSLASIVLFIRCVMRLSTRNLNYRAPRPEPPFHGTTYKAVSTCKALDSFFVVLGLVHRVLSPFISYSALLSCV